MVPLNLFTEALGNVFSPVYKEINNNSTFITGNIVGMVLAWFYHWAFGGRAVTKSYKERLKDKQDDLNSYKAIIHADLEKIQVDKIHENFFKRLKLYFKKGKLALKNKK